MPQSAVLDVAALRLGVACAGVAAALFLAIEHAEIPPVQVASAPAALGEALRAATPPVVSATRGSTAATPQQLASALRGGGLVLYMRHPATDRAQQDSEGLDLADCTTQRNLSAAGRHMAVSVGIALQGAGAALDRTVTSEYCRTREAAALIGLAPGEAHPALNDGGRMAARGPHSGQAEVVRDLLRNPPAPGRSSLIVAHRPNLVDAAGPEFGDLEEGEIAAFRPSPEAPGGFHAVGRIRPGDWPAILGTPVTD